MKPNKNIKLLYELTNIKDGENDVNHFELTTIVKSLKGSFTAPENFDYKIELEKVYKDNSKNHFQEFTVAGSRLCKM